MIEVRELRGVGIGTGVVVGPVLHVARRATAAPADTPSTIGADAELVRAREALASVSGQLRERAANADDTTRDVLEAQALMTDDPALLDSVTARLESGITAERAVTDAFAEFAAMLAEAGEYFGERAADLHDLADRTVAVLQGRRPSSWSTPATRSCSWPATSRPPTPRPARPRAGARLRHHRGRPDLHTAILARSAASSRSSAPRALRALAEGTTVIVDAVPRSRRHTDPDAAERSPTRGADRRAGAAAEAGRHAGGARRRHARPAAGQPRRRRGAPPRPSSSARRASACSAPSSCSSTPRHAPTRREQQESYTRASSPRSRARRSSCARSTRAPTSRWPSSTPGDEENPALGLRGLRALRARRGHPATISWTALAAADAADRRGALGDGAR